MSGFQTHALIGAVAGIGVTRLLDVPLTPTSMSGWLIVAGSMVLATVPDIDEPNSWIARHVRGAIILATAAVSAFAGWIGAWPDIAGLNTPIERAVLGLFVGGIILGPLLGWLVLRLIRRGAGGHRRLTHSGVVALLLAGAAWWLWPRGAQLPAVICGALAYAIVVHDIGDVVTPAGVPLLYPLSSMRVGLPRFIARRGEALIAVLAVVVGLILLAGGRS